MLDLSTLAVGVVTFLLGLGYMKSRRPRDAPPGPFVWPFVGNLRDITGTNTFHFTANEYYQKYGPVASLQCAFYPGVILSDLEVLKKAAIELADHFSERPRWLPFFKRIFANDMQGVAFANGEKYRLHKKLVLSSIRDLGFGSKTLEEKIHEEVEAVIKELDKVKGSEYNFRFLFNKATANVICAVLFGDRYEHSDTEYEYLLERLNYIFKRGGFRNPFIFLPGGFMYLAPLFLSGIPKAIRISTEFEAVLGERVKQHKATFDPDNMRDLIDIFLDTGIEEREIRAVCFDMFVAGSETTSTTLLWAFLFMIKNPEIQEKCRQEIFEVVGTDRLPSMKDKDNLPYTSATIMEVQRMGNTAATGALHNCTQSVELNGYTIPKDSIVIFNIYSVHMDPKNWDKPEVFRPERFLSADQRSTIKPEAFIPFGIGRRACLGENLAKMELFLLFSALIQKFRFTASDPTKLPTLRDCNLGITLIPNDYSVVLHDP